MSRSIDRRAISGNKPEPNGEPRGELTRPREPESLLDWVHPDKAHLKVSRGELVGFTQAIESARKRRSVARRVAVWLRAWWAYLTHVPTKAEAKEIANTLDGRDG